MHYTSTCGMCCIDCYFIEIFQILLEIHHISDDTLVTNFYSFLFYHFTFFARTSLIYNNIHDYILFGTYRKLEIFIWIPKEKRNSELRFCCYFYLFPRFSSNKPATVFFFPLIMTHLANKIRSIFGSFTNVLIIQFQENFSYKCKWRISHSIFRNKWSGILNIFWHFERSWKYNMTNNNAAIKSMESIIETISQCHLGHKNIALLEANNCQIPAFDFC